MNYELISFVIMVFALTFGYLAITKYIVPKFIKKKELYEVFDVTLLVTNFIKAVLKDTHLGMDKVKMGIYCDLVIESVECMMILSEDNVKFDEQLIKGMQNIINMSAIMKLDLDDNEIELMQELLKVTYNFYVLLENDEKSENVENVKKKVNV